MRQQQHQHQIAYHRSMGAEWRERRSALLQHPLPERAHGLLQVRGPRLHASPVFPSFPHREQDRTNRQTSRTRSQREPTEAPCLAAEPLRETPSIHSYSSHPAPALEQSSSLMAPPRLKAPSTAL